MAKAKTATKFAKTPQVLTPEVLESVLERALAKALAVALKSPATSSANTASIPVTPVLSFDPNSFNAQFGQIHETLKQQDRSRNERMDKQDKKLEEIAIQTTKTNGRVTVLETTRKTTMKVMMGWVTIGGGLIAFLTNFIFHIWSKLFH